MNAVGDTGIQGPGFTVAIPFRSTALRNVPSIIGRSVEAVGSSGITTHRREQIDAWRVQAELLDQVATSLGSLIDDWTLVFEFDIPRRGKRIDVVVLAGERIVVLEFKVGSSRASVDSIRQAEDYALELSDFHAGSHDRAIIPAVVATEYVGGEFALADSASGVLAVSKLGASDLPAFFRELACLSTADGLDAIDASAWLASPYQPTPTIIEAARELYSAHDVSAITRSDAEQANLTATQDAIHAAIDEARDSRAKIACFVTGVPGAGKTLAGLNAVHTVDADSGDTDSVFLSGNGPLVKVLAEALARDQAARDEVSIQKARQRSTKFVQNVHRFVDYYSIKHPDEVPHERIVVFDEAQRAWNAEHSGRKFKRATSEPVSMLRIMDRHKDWAVFVGLIGGGQEINTGEAGLREWGAALASEFRHWRIRVSPELLHGDESTVGQTLFETEPDALEIRDDPRLHLRVPVRSYRAKAMGHWVNAVLEGRPSDAIRVISEVSAYPIAITRSLKTARRWLRDNARGFRRCGLVCSSGARRLRIHGIDPKLDFDVAHWFLGGKHDVRSSDYLELAATEFQIQGLELDWVGLRWDADLRVGTNGFEHRRFVGTKWQRVKKPIDQQYLINKYRVLLTRARQGLVIWVPRGSQGDVTRAESFYDPVANYLVSCGACPIDS